MVLWVWVKGQGSVNISLTSAYALYTMHLYIQGWVYQTVQPSRFERDSPAFRNIVPRPAQNPIGTPHVPRGPITHKRVCVRARRGLDCVIETYCPIKQLLAPNVRQPSKQFHARTHAREAASRSHAFSIRAKAWLRKATREVRRQFLRMRICIRALGMCVSAKGARLTSTYSILYDSAYTNLS